MKGKNQSPTEILMLKYPLIIFFISLFLLSFLTQISLQSKSFAKGNTQAKIPFNPSLHFLVSSSISHAGNKTKQTTKKKVNFLIFSREPDASARKVACQ